MSRRICLALAIWAAGCVGACAAGFPTGPVTMVIPTSPGTSSDIVARALSLRLTEKWKQPVVIDNRVGASGSIGIAAVARSAPDGQTILVATNTITMLPSMHKDASWGLKDFQPVQLMGSTVTALIVNPNVPVKNVDELIALARSRPGQLNYGTPGIGTPHHLYSELFKQITGTDIFHVPFSSTSGAITDMAGGRVEMGFFPLNAVQSLIKAGRLKVLAVAGDERSPAMPDVPTFKESKIDGVHAGSWIGVFLPKGVPRPIVDKVTADIAAVMLDPAFQKELIQQEVVPNLKPGGAEELGALAQSDTERWRKVIDVARISAD